ncbi:glycosyltransferase family 4 protein [Gluconobacter sp. Dm-62]|uniref:glycosyltransferase family 4 protein n=1 Tax=Gluconobacter sp. Dm-62 TaxID=2799804 RepID=UPI001B8C1899|nr:glycosyltransferase family 1 protein [Gluconobacter sp. Dm-62]MBS1103240.1 glycosyltransferase family 4 protein [Gluconobacter sp. Dm-62]
MPRISLNGRFSVQSLSGVQRFATEITRALSGIWPVDLPRPELLTPRVASSASTPVDMGFPVRPCGHFQGQLWEQIDLPRAAGHGLLVNLGNTGPLLLPARNSRQIVVIHDAGVFSTPQSYSRQFRAYYKTLHRLLASGRTRIVTVSNFARSDIASHLRIDPARISVITEGAEHATRLPADRTILERNGLEAGKYVLAVGNMAPHKDFAALDHLASTLPQRGVKLVISGGMNKRVFESDIPDLQHATYVGRVTDEELHALYRDAACFVFPSIYEGFGLPPIEAMEAGCPVVARDIPVLHEVCGQAALYGSKPADLTARVLEILDNPSVAKILRHAGEERVRQYRWSIAAGKLLNVMREEFSAC